MPFCFGASRLVYICVRNLFYNIKKTLFMKNLIYLGLAACSLLACKDTETSPVNSCVGEADIPFIMSTCDDLANSQYYCTIEHLGTYTLDAQSKLYMPQFCMAVGDSLVFKNATGESLTLFLAYKFFQKSYSIVGNAPCPNDSSKYDGLCIETERLTMRLSSDKHSLNLGIEITTKLDPAAPGSGNVGDFFTITRQRDSISFWLDMEAVLSQRSLPYATSNFQVFYPEIVLMGKTYRNVLSKDVSNFVSKPFKYFVNQELGLFGFEDSAAVLWILEK
jgi:hypothetical protein